MTRLKIHLQGSFKFEIDDREIRAFHSDKVRALLTYLAIEQGRSHPRETLISLFWPEDQLSSAKASLRTALSNLRNIINRNLKASEAAEAPLQAHRYDVAFKNRHTDVWLDVSHFDQLLAQCHRHSHLNVASCPQCATRLTEAAELYRGELLEEINIEGCPDFEEWLMQARDIRHRLMLSILEILAVHHLSRGGYEQGRRYATRHVEMDPLSESGRRNLMIALAAMGRRNEALTQYHTYNELLAAQLEGKPSSEMEMLHNKIDQNSLIDFDAFLKTTPLAGVAYTGATQNGAAPNLTYHTRNGTDSQQAHASRQSGAITVEEEAASTEQGAVDRAANIEARLTMFEQQKLFGVDELLQELAAWLQSPDHPWIIALEGMGGLGKTTLADRLARDFIESDRYYDIGWVSAKQQLFLPMEGLREIDQPVLTPNMLIQALLEQFLPDNAPFIPPQEQQPVLRRLLKSSPYLVVIDNLETLIDYQTIIPILQSLARPTKFLLTARRSMQGHDNVKIQPVPELPLQDVLIFLRHEAEQRDLTGLQEMTDEHLSQIYAVTGGNPLALKLVLGQLHTLPLSRVLDRLKHAPTDRDDEMYRYIYWDTWHALSAAGKQALLVMPLAGPRGTTFEHLEKVSNLDTDDLSRALLELSRFSIIGIAGDIEIKRYSIHRLTEAFLLTEVTKWPPKT